MIIPRVFRIISRIVVLFFLFLIFLELASRVVEKNFIAIDYASLIGNMAYMENDSSINQRENTTSVSKRCIPGGLGDPVMNKSAAYGY